MKIRELKIRNFRGIDKMDIELNNRLNIFCGINGVGKSTILDSVAIQLSWIIARIRPGKGSGRPISEYDIKNGENYSEVEMLVEDDGASYTGILIKNRKGRLSNSKKSDMNGFSNYAKLIQENIINNKTAAVPVFIYYSTNRVVNDIPLRIRGKQETYIIKTYENSLSSGVTFRSFFEWYRNQEDLENQLFREDTDFIGDKQLEAVRSAIKAISGFESISVKRNPLHMEVKKGNEKLIMEQLSDGEKCLFAMAGDLARRLSIANPTHSRPLEGDGIVLIDEIDLHLHPQWQKKILSGLVKTFPNIQFIVSTHSPQVLSEVDGDKIFALYQTESMGIEIFKVKQAKGLNSSEILEIVMETSPLNSEVKKHIDTIFDAIDNEKFGLAKKSIQEFEHKYGSVPDLTRAETLLTLYSEEE